MPIIIILAVVVMLIFGMATFTGAPYVPSLKKDLSTAFDKLYKLGKKDLLVDLGSGDGKVLDAAIKRGAKAVGVEINPILVLWTKIKYKDAKVFCKNMFKFRLPEKTTVIYVFGDSRDIAKIVRYAQKEATRLKKSLLLISLAFDIKIPGVKLVKSAGSYYLYKINPKPANFSI